MPKSAAPKASDRFVPYADDAAVQTIGGLAIENGTGRIAIHGSLDLMRDALGLERARALAAALGTIVAALEGAPLPDRVAEAPQPAETVKNPFA
ncbi:hypothetical protein ASF49_22615 [Methylobacterium sp. Leaf104]|uniref:hypothetical protein n=1 Tax=Methylobacterium TaxID=407 RepID=UPI0006FEC455|nr:MULTISPECIES: hypothetical protein [Methylobacterium]KQP34982.1 hypothetical protein ASF49_22615 [Methylobacterium sp. Leaf104]MCI9882907.1 hypothetical protein [Methylobacterium goesingense]